MRSALAAQKKNRQTIVQGMPDCFGVPVVN
jgi:hypothetical protein